MLWYPFILLCAIDIHQTDIVTVHVPDLVLKAGKNSTLNIKLDVKSGFHIQGNQISQEFLIRTTIDIDSSENIKPGKAIFPVPKKFRLEGADDWMDVYDDSFRIKIPMETAKQMEKGSYALKAKLRYQACDAKTCFFPKTILFKIPYGIQ